MASAKGYRYINVKLVSCQVENHSICPRIFTWDKQIYVCTCKCHAKNPAKVSQPTVFREAS